MKNESLLVIETFSSVIAAEMAESALDAAEIDSILQSDDSGHLDPALSMTNGVKLLVRAADAADAAEVLEQGTPQGESDLVE